MAFDYTDLTDFWDCEGTLGLLGENSLDFAEVGEVPEAAGKFGDARGPFTVNNRFQRSGSTGLETRVIAGFIAGSFVAWFKTTSNTAIQTVVKFGNTATSSQLALRCVWPGVGDTGDDDPAVLLIYDWALDNGTFQVGGGVRASQGAFPLDTWCMIGFSVDAVAEIARLFLGIPGEGTYFDERSMAGWDAFQSPDSSAWVLGCGFTQEPQPQEPLLGLLDHVTWTNGRFYSQQDFVNHYQGGSGLERESYLQAAVAREYVNPILMAARRKGRGD